MGVFLVLLLACGLAAVIGAALAFNWFQSLWEMLAWIAIAVAFLAVGIGVRAHQTPRNEQIYGGARVASEREAKAAATGHTKTASLHDQTFPD